MSVAVIAAYLAFFPVAVGMLRGLQSPSAIAVELMRSYAAGWWRTLVQAAPAGVACRTCCPALRLAGGGGGGRRGGRRDLHRHARRRSAGW